jgi:hypothetical protein
MITNYLHKCLKHRRVKKNPASTWRQAQKQQSRENSRDCINKLLITKVTP